MTLDIKKYFKNLIDKEATISHFQVKVDAGKTTKIKGQYLSAIKAAFGESYLQDADYVLFFEKAEPWTKADIKSLFKLTNNALGKDANMLAMNDFDKLPMSEPIQDAVAEPEDSEENPNDEETATEPQQDDEDDETNVLFLKITLK